jgi:hypothetical protein
MVWSEPIALSERWEHSLSLKKMMPTSQNIAKTAPKVTLSSNRPAWWLRSCPAWNYKRNHDLRLIWNIQEEFHAQSHTQKKQISPSAQNITDRDCIDLHWWNKLAVKFLWNILELRKRDSHSRCVIDGPQFQWDFLHWSRWASVFAWTSRCKFSESSPVSNPWTNLGSTCYGPPWNARRHR